jgi:hypothetical protein
MSAWVVVDCLKTLRDEFNQLSPNRDKGADGTIGDSSHTSSSDHTPDEDSDKLRNKDADSKNEVHGLDVDSSGPWPAEGHPERSQKQRFHAKVMRIIAGEKAKWMSDNDKCRLNFVIWDRKIYDKDNDFEPRDYTLSDPHTNHAHFSSRYETSCEGDTRPWGVFEEDEMDQTTFNQYMDAWWNDRMDASKATPSAQLTRLRRAPWNQVVGSDGDSMYQWMNKAAQSLAAVQALAAAFNAFVVAEGIEDDDVQTRLAELQTTLTEVQTAVDELDDVPPVEG